MTEVTLTDPGVRGGAMPYPIEDSNKVDLEVYKKAFCEESATIPQMREELAQQGLEGEALESALNDKIVERMRSFEELQKITKLRWICCFRIFEERLAVATEAERTRQLKKDREYRAKAKVETAEAKPAKTPKTKEEKAVAVLMRLGYSEEEAKLRLSTMGGQS